MASNQTGAEPMLVVLFQFPNLIVKKYVWDYHSEKKINMIHNEIRLFEWYQLIG